MRLQELFLVETTEEDRAIISLSSAIYDYLKKYDNEDDLSFDDNDYDPELDDTNVEDDELIFVGKIGNLFNTPLEILNPVSIELQSEEGIRQRMKKEKDAEVVGRSKNAPLGLWYANNSTMVLNKDYMGSNAMKSTISHELRHALDDYKSDFETSRDNSKYTTPKKKDHRKVVDDPYVGNLAYLAQPAEINARYLQVMHMMVPAIKRASRLEPNQVRPSIMRDLKRALETHRIADLFPEKEKSRDYKRLIKRAIDFIDKELAHIQSN